MDIEIMKTSFCLSTTYIEKSIVKCEEPESDGVWESQQTIGYGEENIEVIATKIANSTILIGYQSVGINELATYKQENDVWVKKDIVTDYLYGDLSDNINEITISSNGDVIFLTSPILLFRYNGTEWLQENFVLTEYIPPYHRHAGYFVDETAYILRDFDNNQFTFYFLDAYEFNDESQSWEFAYQIMPNDTTTNQPESVFGFSLVGIDDYLFVGEPTKAGHDNQHHQGYVNVYEKINDSYTQVDRLQASDSEEGFSDYFGSTLDVYGNYLIVGAPYANDAGASSGAVYIFENINGEWTEIKKIISSDLNIFDNFGWSSAINDEYFVVGAMAREGLEGGVYFYRIEDMFLHSEFAADRSDTSSPKVIQFNSICIGDPTSYL